MNPDTQALRLPPPDKMLVSLDLTDIDLHLVRYAGMLAELLQAGEVIFFHAIQAYALPDRKRQDFPDLETELSARIEAELHRSVDEHFSDVCKWRVVTTVSYEDAARDVVSFVNDEAIDLTLIGQKSGVGREERSGKRIAADIRGDLLFVPDTARLTIERLLFAGDFSEATDKAFKRALGLASVADAVLTCYFVADAARAYFPATTERSQKKYRQQCDTAYREFLERFGFSPDDIPCTISEGEVAVQQEAERIYRLAEEDAVDLILIGARGDTSTVTSLLGNLCESLRLMEKQIPVMIVKHAPPRKALWN